VMKKWVQARRLFQGSELSMVGEGLIFGVMEV
jgi:hypothetical protein